MKFLTTRLSALALALAATNPVAFTSTAALSVITMPSTTFVSVTVIAGGTLVLSGTQVKACGGPCPEPEPEPEPPVKVDDDRDPPVVVPNPCTPYPHDLRTVGSQDLADKLTVAYFDAADDGNWVKVWVKGGKVLRLVYKGEEAPEVGAKQRWLTLPPFLDDEGEILACVKITGGMKMANPTFVPRP